VRQGRVQRLLDDARSSTPRRAAGDTRAALRGRFIRQAKAKRRDYTVDWVHLKLNDQAQRTVLCKDPFRYEDERVDKLIASM
jgi:proteasome accessory factor A